MEAVEWRERKSESLEWGLRGLGRMDIWWSWVGGSEGVSQERSESGLGECPGGAAVRAARRAGTEPGRPHGPGGPARPAPAAKLKGGRSLSLLFPTAPPRAPGGAQAGLTSGPRVTRGGGASFGAGPLQPHGP